MRSNDKVNKAANCNISVTKGRYSLVRKSKQPGDSKSECKTISNCSFFDRYRRPDLVGLGAGSIGA